MIDYAFVMTIFVMLLGPIKVIPQFARMTKASPAADKRKLALLGFVFATMICALVAFLSQSFVAKYHLSIAAIQLAGGAILLLSALNGIFPKALSAPSTAPEGPSVQMALSPLASPVIVTPAGIAAIMVFVLLAGNDPAPFQQVLWALGIVMLMNLVVMLLIDPILKIPGIMVALQLAGVFLLVVQVALAFQVMIYSFARLGLVTIG